MFAHTLFFSALIKLRPLAMSVLLLNYHPSLNPYLSIHSFLLFFFFLFLFKHLIYSYECFCGHAYLCTTCVLGVQGVLKKVWSPLELKSQKVVNHYVGAEN